MFKDDTTVSSIAPMNEPAGFYGDDILKPIKQYWYDSYGSIRFPYGSSQQSNTLVMLHDAFMPVSYWQGFMQQPGWQGVAMDVHRYQVFSDEVCSSSAITSHCAEYRCLGKPDGLACTYRHCLQAICRLGTFLSKQLVDGCRRVVSGQH
jgi:hypothetical protein